MAAFIDFADLVKTITDWAHIVLVGALIYYGYLIFKGGEEGTTTDKAWGFSKDAASKIGGFSKDFYKRQVKGEKAILSEFSGERKELQLLEETKKLVDKKAEQNKIKSAANDVKRQLKGRLNRLTRQMYRITKKLSETGKKVKGFDEDKIDAMRNEILERHNEIDKQLDKVINGTSMKKNINDAIGNEKAVIQMLRGMLAMEKELFEK